MPQFLHLWCEQHLFCVKEFITLKVSVSAPRNNLSIYLIYLDQNMHCNLALVIAVKINVEKDCREA